VPTKCKTNVPSKSQQKLKDEGYDGCSFARSYACHVNVCVAFVVFLLLLLCIILCYFKSHLARFRNSNPAGSGAGFGENLFLDHRTIHLMKLMASLMLSAAIKRQYSSVFSLLQHYLPVFNKICGAATNFVFLTSG